MAGCRGSASQRPSGLPGRGRRCALPAGRRPRPGARARSARHGRTRLLPVDQGEGSHPHVCRRGQPAPRTPSIASARHSLAWTGKGIDPIPALLATVPVLTGVTTAFRADWWVRPSPLWLAIFLVFLLFLALRTRRRPRIPLDISEREGEPSVGQGSHLRHGPRGGTARDGQGLRVCGRVRVPGEW